MNKLLNLFAALLMVVAVSAHGASVTLGSSSNNVITATITPDTAESGTANVYMAALFNNTFFFRGATTIGWTPWTGGTYPIATTVSLGGGAKTVTVVDLDISIFPGLTVFVAYGKTEAELSLPGHLGLVYTVPTPVTTTTTTTTTTQAPTTTTTATTTTTTSGGGSAQIARGKAVFNDPRFCIQCHSPIERAGRSAAQIQDSINGSVPAMSFLAALDASDIAAVAAYLADPANF